MFAHFIPFSREQHIITYIMNFRTIGVFLGRSYLPPNPCVLIYSSRTVITSFRFYPFLTLNYTWFMDYPKWFNFHPLHCVLPLQPSFY